MIIEQYPYIDEYGTARDNLIRHYSDDETKNLLQVETGIVYEDAVDVYPCRYTYKEVDKPAEEENQEPLDPEAAEVLE